jgi:signal transduction histidine kinase
MIRVGGDRREALELIRKASLTGQAQLSPHAFLERVCVDVAEAFDLDRVAAARYHAESGEVSEIAFAGAPATGLAGRRPISSAPLLAQARERGDLVHVSSWDVGDAFLEFALPLISDGRCLGFLFGSRRGIVPVDEDELDVLRTIGVIAATLFNGALVREDLQQRDLLKSEFIALAAHELRNSVSSVYGLCVTMDERGDSLGEPDRLALRAALREQATKMRILIEQLLDLSRFDLAAIDIAPERVRLRPRIEALARVAAGARPEAVTVSVGADLEAVIDPTALDRMLSNLVANALRHGEPPVTVTAARRDKHLRLAVEDRGEGVPAEFVPRLFDRFARSSEAKGQTDGSGLGLSITRAYARAHGGDIVYEPAIPRGARFEVVLPLSTEEARRTEALTNPHREC